MSSHHHKRSTNLRNRDRFRIKASKPNCHICGEAIDYSLKWPDPKCYVVDHVVPLDKGGEDTMANKRAAHNGCNSKKRARVVAPIVRRSGTLT